jgi:hypothetical protein
MIESQKILVGLLLNGKRKTSFSLSSQIDDLYFGHRSGCPSRARLLIDPGAHAGAVGYDEQSLIWVPRAGRVDDF